jgi:hypothetical protein
MWQGSGLQTRWWPQNVTPCNRAHQLPPHAGLMWTPLGNSRGDMWKHTLVKIVKHELSKGKHPSSPCRVRTVHKNGVWLHLDFVCNANFQRGIFPEISHSQALLGGLVSVPQKF